MRSDVRAAPERSGSAFGTPDFASAVFASAAASEVVSMQCPAASYQPAEVAYEVAAPAAASPSSIVPAA